ncbi:hypothetical protein DY000_02022190 [Brassica cretica]|uniref:Reverse transcriptase zinc-binding domain-containing protein n=1 Tax=Brassica cretica TaxID=69181 RepID=A0ABQ7E0X9_BRACR|nr:hypothetical protein DY000_02022190 [Brassica cretica]
MSGSLWVAWAHTELMKSGSFWDVKESTKGTWLCRTRRLIDETGELGPQYLGISRQALVSEAYENGEWKMRSRGRRVYTNTYDTIESAQRTDIRIRRQEVPWNHLVWYTQGVPRQAFTVWLGFRDSLSTRVRMRSWGITQGFYFIWKERNSRRHQGAWLTTETLIMHIDKSIRNRIVSLEYLGIIS